MLINNKKNMIQLLKRAFCGENNKIHADEEYLDMLASGRYEEIPEQERKKLLAAIVQNSEESSLLKDLYEVKKGPQSVKRVIAGYRIMTLGWGIAACLMIGLFVSRAIDPSPQGDGVQIVKPYGVEADPDYWSQLDKQRLSMQSKWHTYRDVALVISTITCVVLSVGLLFVIRREHKSQDI